MRRPAFRLLFAGVVATMVGESALLLVLAIWVKVLTGSSSLAGTTIFAVAAPALFAPVLGWVVDRFHRRPFLIATNLATAAALTPLLLVRDRGDVWLIYTVAVLYGVSMLVAGAALNGLLKDLLPEELLAEANGAVQTVRQGLRLVGPIGGAALFTTLGSGTVVGLDIGCLLLGALAVSALKLHETGVVASHLTWLSEVGAGLRHLFGTASLRRATFGLCLAMTVLGFTETLIFAYVDLGLHRPPAFITVIVCVQGIGGLTGGLSAAGVVRRLGELATTALGVAMFGLAFVGLIYANLALGFASAIVMGFGIPLAIVGFNTLMQRVTPSAVLGRVSTAADAVISTPQALSIAGGAALATVVDYRLLFAFMTVVMVAAGAYLWVGRSLAAPVVAERASARVGLPPPREGMVLPATPKLTAVVPEGEDG
jgi:Major Facilitator Superfamily